MEKLSVEGLADRIERLEQENRWLKRFGVLILLGTGSLVIHFTNLGRPAKEVVAERFVVKDSRGHARATLSLRHDGQPALAILDEAGRDQIFLGSTSDLSSSLEFADRGRTRLSMRSTTNGASSLDLVSKDRDVAAGLYVWPDRETGLAITRGRSNVNLGLKADGSAKLVVRDTEGRPVSSPDLDKGIRIPVMSETVDPKAPAHVTTGSLDIRGEDTLGPQACDPADEVNNSYGPGGGPRPGLLSAP